MQQERKATSQALCESWIEKLTPKQIDSSMIQD